MANQDGIFKQGMKKILRKLIGTAIGFVILVGGVFAYSFFSDSASIQTLKAGDCFLTPDNSGELDLVTAPDCDKPHDSQVFHTFDSGSLSGEEVDATCAGQVSSSVDTSKFDSGTFAVDSYIVQKATASATTFTAICFITHPTQVSESYVKLPAD